MTKVVLRYIPPVEADSLEDVELEPHLGHNLMDEARAYHVRADLGRLESPHYDYRQATLVFDSPVPVYSEAGDQVGFASLEVCAGGRVAADLSVDYATPERLAVQERTERLYAYLLADVDFFPGEPSHVGFRVSKVGWAWDLRGVCPRIREVHVYGVALLRRRPLDQSVSPLGEPVP